MPFLALGSYRIRYELEGPERRAGLRARQWTDAYAELWAVTATHWSRKAFASRHSICSARERPTNRALLHQPGRSGCSARAAHRPARRRRSSWAASASAADRIRDMRSPIPDRLAGLVAMSAFAELSPQLLSLGNALRTGLILGGTSYLQDLLLPMNLSDAWLGPLLGNLEASSGRAGSPTISMPCRISWSLFPRFQPITPQLASLRCRR